MRKTPAAILLALSGLLLWGHDAKSALTRNDFYCMETKSPVPPTYYRVAVKGCGGDPVPMCSEPVLCTAISENVKKIAHDKYQKAFIALPPQVRYDLVKNDEQGAEFFPTVLTCQGDKNPNSDHPCPAPENCKTGDVYFKFGPSPYAKETEERVKNSVPGVFFPAGEAPSTGGNPQ